jgi:putative transposase
VHWYRNIFSHVPAAKMREVALMLKAIHASESRPTAQKKALEVIARLREMRLARAAEIAERGVEETLAYYAFPEEHWRASAPTIPWSASCARSDGALASSEPFLTANPP